MSSTVKGYGLRQAYSPVQHQVPKKYRIASGYAVSIYTGDPVKVISDGTITLATSDGTRSGTVVSTIPIMGVFQGCEWTDSTDGRPRVSSYWPASTTTAAGTTITAYVIEATQDVVFSTQMTNPSSGTDIQASVGYGAAWTPQAAGTSSTSGGYTSTGNSSTYIAEADGTSGQLQVCGIAPQITDAVTDAYVDVLVRVKSFQYGPSGNSLEAVV